MEDKQINEKLESLEKRFDNIENEMNTMQSSFRENTSKVMSELEKIRKSSQWNYYFTLAITLLVLADSLTYRFNPASSAYYLVFSYIFIFLALLILFYIIYDMRQNKKRIKYTFNS